MGLAGSGRGAPPPRGGVPVPRLLCCMFYPAGPTQFSLFAEAQRAGSDTQGPSSTHLDLSCPSMTCHSLLPTFRLQPCPPGVGFPCTQIETRGLRTPGGRGGLWLEKASENTPTWRGLHGSFDVSLLWGWSHAMSPSTHPEWQDHSLEGGRREHSALSDLQPTSLL